MQNKAYGVDASYSRLTPDIANKLWDAGVRVFWQCLWTGAEQPPLRVENLRVAQQGGFTLIGYTSVTSRGPGSYHAKMARAGVPDDLWGALVTVVTDVELKGISNDIIRGCVDTLVGLGKSMKVIYTSLGHWTSEQGNTSAFTDCYLANAFWDEDPDIDFPQHPYGGWREDQVLLEQFTGGVDIQGIFVDQDVWDMDILKPAPQPVVTLPSAVTPEMFVKLQLTVLKYALETNPRIDRLEAEMKKLKE